MNPRGKRVGTGTWRGRLMPLLLQGLVCSAQVETLPDAAPTAAPEAPAPERESRLPFLAEEARKRGIELPRPYGIGVVYYKLLRDIRITDVRVGRNGTPPTSLSAFVDMGSTSDVDNLNLKFDAWLLPFLNVYAIVGKLHNESHTRLDAHLPAILPGGTPRRFQMEVPTELDGTVTGLGITLAGGYGPFFMAVDVNAARADLGFSKPFEALISSGRFGWNGNLGGRPFRTWLNATRWDTYATATGTVADPDGGTLKFEVDQGPAYAYTYGAGCSYGLRRWLELSVDTGTDFHGGWYVALVPVFRF